MRYCGRSSDKVPQAVRALSNKETRSLPISGVKEVKFWWYVGNCPEMGEGRATLDRWSEKDPNDEKEGGQVSIGGPVFQA